MGHTKTHAQLLDQAEALLHMAQRIGFSAREPLRSQQQEWVRVRCAKARICINRASTSSTWFGRQISPADLERAVALTVALDKIAPPLADYMTVYEAAAFLGVGHERVSRYIAEGRLPATKFGNQWRLRTADVKSFRRLPSGRPSRAQARERM